MHQARRGRETTPGTAQLCAESYRTAAKYFEVLYESTLTAIGICNCDNGCVNSRVAFVSVLTQCSAARQVKFGGKKKNVEMEKYCRMPENQ
eukprot:m.25816 g.25816  ORF g.25816 m.25816 type:complete len:91 (-) comp11586_c0_seq1:93-365(-)